MSDVDDKHWWFLTTSNSLDKYITVFPAVDVVENSLLRFDITYLYPPLLA